MPERPMSTQDVIYIITCVGYNEFYIGETGNTLRECCRIHKEQINIPAYRKISVSKHLDECSRGRFTIFPFYRMYNTTDIFRKTKDRCFIDLFHPKLNAKWQTSKFL